jgi:hypothetical protein
VLRKPLRGRRQKGGVDLSKITKFVSRIKFTTKMKYTTKKNF